MKETHILVMEDDATISAALDMILTEVGYDVDVAETGEAALELFEQKPFDLIIADLKLPGINGMEVIRQIKEKKTGNGSHCNHGCWYSANCRGSHGIGSA